MCGRVGTQQDRKPLAVLPFVGAFVPRWLKKIKQLKTKPQLSSKANADHGLIEIQWSNWPCDRSIQIVLDTEIRDWNFILPFHSWVKWEKISRPKILTTPLSGWRCQAISNSQNSHLGIRWITFNYCGILPVQLKHTENTSYLSNIVLDAGESRVSKAVLFFRELRV